MAPVACVLLEPFAAWAVARTAWPRRPVVIVERDVVAAASRAAERAGVAVGMAAERVAGVCPEAAVRVRDRFEEDVVWEDALGRLHTLTPFLEAPAPGVALLQAWDEEGLLALVHAWGARGGVAPHRAWARLAARRAGAGHILALAPRDAAPFLRTAPVALFTEEGLDARVAERLHLLGFRTLGACRRLTERQWKAPFGPDGAAAFRILHPDPKEAPVARYQPPPALRAALRFDDPVREPGELVPAVDLLVAKACGALGALHARRVTVRVEERQVFPPRFASRVLREATGDAPTVRLSARALLLDLLDGREVEGVAVELGGLRARAAEQGALFRARPPVCVAVRGVHRRFPGAIRRAILTVEALFPEDRFAFVPFPEAPPVRGRRARA